ncbi:site-2 protease family protein [Streptomyces montanisoli]|uniref:Site-2 protease family protein n=1 Tax=Streptomyces montanisoli TaxID=2798581 RepID=A0A940RVW7_9ACTN|nr:site-2 protease family protein [Streptomyces montanisoli]MBP0456039.1 site-2 protease family protein [Streptomyces montanisoli]
MSEHGRVDAQPSTAERSSPSGWKVGRAFGVPLYVRPSALIFFAVLALLYTPVVRTQFPGIDAFGYVVALVAPALIAFSVFGHELGHLLAGRLAGIPATRITLDVLGGETEFDRDAPTAGREALIAASGPAASILMSALGYAAQIWMSPEGFTSLLIAQFALVNLLLAAFNLLPGLPLDGGWILRAGLWKATGRSVLSVRAAAWIGRLLAAALLTDLVVRFARGSAFSLLVVVTVLMVAYQIWSGASAALRDFPRTPDALPESVPDKDAAQNPHRVQGPGGEGPLSGW